MYICIDVAGASLESVTFNDSLMVLLLSVLVTVTDSLLGTPNNNNNNNNNNKDYLQVLESIIHYAATMPASSSITYLQHNYQMSV